MVQIIFMVNIIMMPLVFVTTTHTAKEMKWMEMDMPVDIG